MTTQFAKLFETESLGQILVKLDEEDGVEVRYFFVPEGLGVCYVAATFNSASDDDNWKNAEEYFSKIDEASAIRMVESVIESSLGEPA